MVKQTIRVLVLALSIITAAGCSDSEVLQHEDREIMADCFLEFNLLAWHDANGNGLRDPSEKPMENVAFSVSGDFAQRWPREPCLSDEEGWCKVRIWHPGFCSANDYIITAEPPEAYMATTPELVTVHYESDDFDSRLLFGFRKDPEIMADCFIEFNLKAWQDENINGVWEDSEAPLRGVDFSIDGEIGQSWPRESCQTDEKGQCNIKVWYPGFCSAKDFTIKANPPGSYTPTTPDMLTIYYGPEDISSTATFGFKGQD